VAPVLHDVRPDDGDIVDLMNGRVRILPGEGMRTVVARVRLEGPALIGHQERTLGIEVARLPAPTLARRGLGRSGFDLRCVGRRGYR
jgi:hypothetical protein